MGRLGKKKEQTGSENRGSMLQVPATTVADVPLVLVNDGAASETVSEPTRERKRSRSISRVSMTVGDEKVR